MQQPRLIFAGVILLAILIMLGATSVRAQSSGGYTLDWFSVNSGGQSTGGEYTLSGIGGQADAGGLSGDGYTLNGGFWQSKDPRVYLPIVLR